MTVLGINRIGGWVQIFSDSLRNYTCATKEIDGELFFRFKQEWHPVAKYLTEHTTELVKENRKIISRLVTIQEN